ncbi:hypothetical protein A1O7_03026 [Cladophialophora yegresii CBS 114405]|uniref:Proteophosphoglycan 5 n=1 Tax=Cladophialophora yegresii CBS 114405 TaxID=1182544 RepID=W9W3R3_9EURO|nr:uncharacterized protein A1O7_03026 [Cladophialophora yegresii CBS 114405]EXJ62588.1 hypothetical protein A1O7_03026 [Cladophialophora yegresii CBS 114405]
MSAPITTPKQPAQKAPRRSGRKHRPSEADSLSLDGSAIPSLPSAAGPQRNPSPATANTTKNNSNKAQQRNSPQPLNKHQSAVKHVNNNNPHYEKAKATPTPMKPAAYAGSTFQQSPAASALPLPSFYSKSLPTAASIPLKVADAESPSAQAATITPAGESPSKAEATPCDFLFQAARQARANSRADSPATRAGNVSVLNGSPASRSPAPREGDPMFPFELDGATPGEDGSAFATPFKDRIAAARSTSTGGKSMNDDERKAKTEALKKLLMKSSAQENNHVASHNPNTNNPFNARAPYSRTPAVSQPSGPARATSNPSTPLYSQDVAGPYPVHNFGAVGYPFPTPQTQTPKRPNSSRLRHVYGAQSEPEYAELSSDSAVTPPSSSQRNTTHHQQPPQYNPYISHPQMPTHRAKPSAQQLEDDLRRVLKLDLVSRG